MKKRPIFPTAYSFAIDKGRLLRFFFILLLFAASVIPAFAQAGGTTPQDAESRADVKGAPVLLDNKPVFEIREVNGGVTIEERALNVSSRIKKLADNRSIDVAKLRIDESPASSDIVSGDTGINSVLDADAKA